MEFVTDTSERIVLEYDRLLTPAAMHAEWADLWQYVDAGDCLEQVKADMVLHIIEGKCNFWMRISLIARRWPLRLAWLVWNPSHVKCTKRKSIASELLALLASGVAVDGVTLKLVTLFATQLRETEQTGQLDKFLYDMIDEILAVWLLDTQEIEGINSVIKHITKLARSISIQLLSDRVKCKKSIPYYDTPAAREDLLRLCVSQHEETLAHFKSRSKGFADVKVESASPLETFKEEPEDSDQGDGDGDDDEGGSMTELMGQQSLRSQHQHHLQRNHRHFHQLHLRQRHHRQMLQIVPTANPNYVRRKIDVLLFC